MSIELTLQNKKVRQSNVLIEATYSQEFTAMELKIFEIALACCKSEDMELFKMEKDKKLSFTRLELSKILDINPSIVSQEAYRISSSLMKKYIEIKNTLEDDTIEFIQIGIMPFCKYVNGIFTAHWNHRLIPFLLEIKSNFTEFNLQHLLSINTAYGIKLYKLLYQYKRIKFRSFELDELRKQFGVIDKYPQYKNFKQKIIEPSVEQINRFTDLNVTYKEIKLGRKVVELEFTFELKQIECSEIKSIKLAEDINSSSYVFSAETGVDELSAQTKNLISKYSQEKGDEYVEACINYAKRNAKSNLDKYLADTLTKGWADLEIKKAKNKKKNAIAKVEKVKIEENKKKQEKEQENLAKSELEHEWNKLLDSEKQNFIDYSNFIIKKHNSKLTTFADLDQKLPLSIFAVTNNKFYDRSLEGYIKHIINISLNLNNFIAN